MPLKTILGAAAFVGVALAAPMAGAQAIKLRISTGFPSVHDTSTKLIAPWVDEVSQRSGVKLEMELFAAGSSLGGLDRQLTQVQRGLVDAAIGLAAVPRGRMPHLLLGDAPFLSSDSAVLNAAFTDIWDDVAKDFPDVRLVGVAVDCSKLHTVSKPIKSVDDLKGLRIRAPSAIAADLIAAVGAVPVTMPQAEIYENLERHVIDGSVTPWDVIEALKLGEVQKYHDTNNLFCGELWFGFNQKKFDSLPEAVRKAIGELDREAFAARAQKLYAATSESARKFVTARGNTIGTMAPAEIARWKELSQPAIEKYLAETEAAGVSDIRQVYARLIAAVKKRSEDKPAQ